MLNCNKPHFLLVSLSLGFVEDCGAAMGTAAPIGDATGAAGAVGAGAAGASAEEGDGTTTGGGLFGAATVTGVVGAKTGALTGAVGAAAAGAAVTGKMSMPAHAARGTTYSASNSE
jgi:hypothetical protein